MKIAILAPIEEQVPPKKYGGTELVVYNLAEELVKMGHDVTLLATGDSETSAKLVPIFLKAIRTSEKAKDLNMRNSLKLIGVGRALEYLNENDFDIIYNHIGWMILPFLHMIKDPVITTFHGFLNIPFQREMYSNYADANYISISKSQRRFAPPKLNFVGNVYNGIAIDKFRFFPEHKDYFAFLARISPEKGALEAIQIAKLAGVRLVMGGKVDPVDEEYFKNKIEPFIDGNQIQFIGELGHEEKMELLGNAKGLLAPIQWEEPFGLFFIESMICGTPVIANNRGSVPEIIMDGKTGFIVNSIEEAAEKIKHIGIINRKDCHDYVKNNFSAKKMAEEYLDVFEKLVSK